MLRSDPVDGADILPQVHIYTESVSERYFVSRRLSEIFKDASSASTMNCFLSRTGGYNTNLNVVFFIV